MLQFIKGNDVKQLQLLSESSGSDRTGGADSVSVITAVYESDTPSHQREGKVVAGVLSSLRGTDAQQQPLFVAGRLFKAGRGGCH